MAISMGNKKDISYIAKTHSHWDMSKTRLSKNEKNSVMGVEKMHLMINFVWKFLDSDMKDSSAINIHRVAAFIEEIPTHSLSIA